LATEGSPTHNPKAYYCSAPNKSIMPHASSMEITLGAICCDHGLIITGEAHQKQCLETMVYA